MGWYFPRRLTNLGDVIGDYEILNLYFTLRLATVRAMSLAIIAALLGTTSTEIRCREHFGRDDEKPSSRLVDGFEPDRASPPNGMLASRRHAI